MTGTIFTKRSVFNASTTIEDDYCEIRPGALLVTSNPDVRVTLNAPLSIAMKWMQCFDTSRGGYFLVGARGLIDEFTSAMFGAFGDANMSTSALRALIAACFGAPDNPNSVANKHLNRAAKTGPGDFLLDDTLVLPHPVGGTFSGYGELATRFVQTRPNTTAIRTTSLAYTDLTNFYVTSSVPQDESVALLDLDDDGTPGTASLQNNRVTRVYLDGAGRCGIGLWYARSNRMGSETAFEQCYGIGFTRAAYRQDSWNALANRIVGCNFSGNRKNSVEINLGSCHVLFSSFQNQGGDGWDVYYNEGASVSCVYGNRSESLRHCSAGPYSMVDVRASMVVPAIARWAPGTAYAAGALCTGNDCTGDGKLYRAAFAGVSGAAEPQWADGVTDGSLTWQHVEFDVASIRGGSVAVSVLPLGRLDASAANIPLVVDGIVTGREDFNTVAYLLPGESLRQFAVHVLKGAVGPATNAPLGSPRQMVTGNYSVAARP